MTKMIEYLNLFQMLNWLNHLSHFLANKCL